MQTISTLLLLYVSVSRDCLYFIRHTDDELIHLKVNSVDFSLVRVFVRAALLMSLSYIVAF